MPIEITQSYFIDTNPSEQLTSNNYQICIWIGMSPLAEINGRDPIFQR